MQYKIELDSVSIHKINENHYTVTWVKSERIKSKSMKIIHSGIKVIPDKGEVLYCMSTCNDPNVIIESRRYVDEKLYDLDFAAFNMSDMEINLTDSLCDVYIVKDNVQGYWTSDDLYIATDHSVILDKTSLTDFPDGHKEVFISYRNGTIQNNGK